MSWPQQGRLRPSEVLLQILGMRSSAIQNFVLESDPVPRAMLSVDPTFVYLKRFSAVKSLLELREQWLGGQPTFSPKRFLYENVGDVHLILWRSRNGLQVSSYAPGISNVHMAPSD